MEARVEAINGPECMAKLLFDILIMCGGFDADFEGHVIFL
jgi:hypothetical protein